MDINFFFFFLNVGVNVQSKVVHHRLDMQKSLDCLY